MGGRTAGGKNSETPAPAPNKAAVISAVVPNGLDDLIDFVEKRKASRSAHMVISQGR